MNRIKNTVGALCVAATVLTTTVLYQRSTGGSADQDRQRAALRDELRRNASLIDRGHTPGWTGADNTRVGLMAPNQPVSDADFRWMLRKLDLRTVDRDSQIVAVEMTVSVLVRAKLTPPQQARLVRAALPLLVADEPSGDIEEYACKVFVRYPDRGAVPRLYALTRSAHPWVRRDSARALAASGENVPIPPRPTVW